MINLDKYIDDPKKKRGKTYIVNLDDLLKKPETPPVAETQELTPREIPREVRKTVQVNPSEIPQLSKYFGVEPTKDEGGNLRLNITPEQMAKWENEKSAVFTNPQTEETQVQAPAETNTGDFLKQQIVPMLLSTLNGPTGDVLGKTIGEENLPSALSKAFGLNQETQDKIEQDVKDRRTLMTLGKGTLNDEVVEVVQRRVGNSLKNVRDMLGQTLETGLESIYGSDLEGNQTSRLKSSVKLGNSMMGLVMSPFMAGMELADIVPNGKEMVRAYFWQPEVASLITGAITHDLPIAPEYKEAINNIAMITGLKAWNVMRKKGVTPKDKLTEEQIKQYEEEAQKIYKEYDPIVQQLKNQKTVDEAIMDIDRKISNPNITKEAGRKFLEKRNELEQLKETNPEAKVDTEYNLVEDSYTQYLKRKAEETKIDFNKQILLEEKEKVNYEKLQKNTDIISNPKSTLEEKSKAISENEKIIAEFEKKAEETKITKEEKKQPEPTLTADNVQAQIFDIRGKIDKLNEEYKSNNVSTEKTRIESEIAGLEGQLKYWESKPKEELVKTVSETGTNKRVEEPNTAKDLVSNLKNELGELNKEIAERQKTETKPTELGKEKVQEKGEVGKQPQTIKEVSPEGLSFADYKKTIEDMPSDSVIKINGKEIKKDANGIATYKGEEIDLIESPKKTTTYLDIVSLPESNVSSKTFKELREAMGSNNSKEKIPAIMEYNKRLGDYNVTKAIEAVKQKFPKVKIESVTKEGNKKIIIDGTNGFKSKKYIVAFDNKGISYAIEVLDNTKKFTYSLNGQAGRNSKNFNTDIKYEFGKDTPNTKSPFKLDLEKDGLTPETFWKDVQGKLEQNAGQTGIAKAYEQAKTRLSKLSDTALDASSLPFKVAEYLKDVSIVGAYWINKGVRRIGDWTRKMTQELGDKAVPYLRDIWEGLNPPPQLREGSQLHTMGISRSKKPMSFGEFVAKNQDIKKTELLNEYDKYLGGRTFNTGKKTVRDRIPMGEKKGETKFNPRSEVPETAKYKEEMVEKEQDKFSKDKRERITDRQVERTALNLVDKITDKKVLDIKQGDVKPVEEWVAIAEYVAKRTKDAYETGNLNDITYYDILRMNMTVSSLKSESARMLGQGSRVVSKLNANEKSFLEKIVNEKLTGEQKVEGQGFIDKAKKENSETLWDKARYFIYNSYLSRPVTQVRNFLGTGVNFAYEMGNVALHSPNSLKKLNPKNVMPILKKEWKDILETGRGSSKYYEGIYKSYQPKGTPFKDTVRKTMPLTWMQMFDASFRLPAKEVWKDVEARRLGKQFKESPDTMIKLMEDVMNGKEISESKVMEIEKALDAVERFADTVTFQQELGKRGKGLQKFVAEAPELIAIMPFIKTPINIIKAGLQPAKMLKFFNPKYRERFKELTPTQRKQELSKIATQTLMFAGLTKLVFDGTIDVTGNGSDNMAERTMLERTGWKPNSIKLGNTYYSFQNLSPFNTFLGLLGNYMDDIRYNKKPKDDELTIGRKIVQSVAGLVETLTEQSYLQGISNFFKYLRTDDPYYADQLLMSGVPGFLFKDYQTYKGYINDEERVYDNKTWWDKFRNKVGFTDGLTEKIDIFGDPRTRTYETLPLPYKEKEDKLARLLLDNNVSVGFAMKSTLKPNGEKMSEEEYYKYQKQSGQLAKQTLLNNYEILRKKSPAEMDKEVDGVFKDAREVAYKNLFGEKGKKDSYKREIKIDGNGKKQGRGYLK